MVRHVARMGEMRTILKTLLERTPLKGDVGLQGRIMYIRMEHEYKLQLHFQAGKISLNFRGMLLDMAVNLRTQGEVFENKVLRII